MKQILFSLLIIAVLHFAMANSFYRPDCTTSWFSKLFCPSVVIYNIGFQVYLLFAFINVWFWYGFADIYEEGLNEEKSLSRGNSTSGSEISCVDSGRKKIQDCHTALPKEKDPNIDELEKALSWSLAPKLGPRIPVLSSDSLDVEVTEIVML